MGYQEMVVELTPKQTPTAVLKKIRDYGIHYFIDLLGFYCENEQQRYMVFGGDRHPGADFLVKKFKARTMEEVYDEFEQKFEFVRAEDEEK